MSDADSAYAERLQREGKKWGDHLAVEAGQEMYAWLDHPSIRAHYEVRSRVESQPWRRWLASYFHGPAHRSMELGCGSGSLNVELYQIGAVLEIEGVDASAERVQEAEARRKR